MTYGTSTCTVCGAVVREDLVQRPSEWHMTLAELFTALGNMARAMR